MNRKIIISGVALIVVLASAFLYLQYRNRTLSPPGKASLTAGALTVSVEYSRPSVRGRVIFGTKEQGALQPYGTYWRLGANEATEISFGRNVQFNGEKISAGTYTMYAIPGHDKFEIVLNIKTGKWGYSEPDHTQDVLRTAVPVMRHPHAEQFTIGLSESASGMDIVITWSDVRLVIPVKAA